MNVIVNIAIFVFCAFCAITALGTVFSLLNHTFSLINWCAANSGELLIVGVLVYVVYERCFKKG